MSTIKQEIRSLNDALKLNDIENFLKKHESAYWLQLCLKFCQNKVQS